MGGGLILRDFRELSFGGPNEKQNNKAKNTENGKRENLKQKYKKCLFLCGKTGQKVLSTV